MMYGELNNYLPTKNLYINVDKDYCLKNGIVDPKDRPIYYLNTMEVVKIPYSETGFNE